MGGRLKASLCKCQRFLLNECTIKHGREQIPADELSCLCENTRRPPGRQAAATGQAEGTEQEEEGKHAALIANTSVRSQLVTQEKDQKVSTSLSFLWLLASLHSGPSMKPQHCANTRKVKPGVSFQVLAR